MKSVRIPKFLHEIHGKESRIADLYIIYLFAISITILNYGLINQLLIPVWKIVLHLIIVFDISGGVIANFSYSTNLYYSESNKRRLGFLSLHVLQPIVLIIVFRDYLYEISILAVITLISSFIINAVIEARLQKIIGIFITVSILVALSFIKIDILSLYITLQLFVLKLALSFSVKWH